MSFFNVCCFYSSGQYSVWFAVGDVDAVPKVPVILHTFSKVE